MCFARLMDDKLFNYNLLNRGLWARVMRVIEMKAKLEEKIKALEEEKNMLLEEISQLREVAELSEKAKNLEDEVDKLRKEFRNLKGKIPQELLQEFDETVSSSVDEEKCSSCEEEEFM